MATKQQEKDFALEFDNCVTLTTGALDVAITWIRDSLDPDDVFHKWQLENWAESNGYVKE